jgi:hypothetical protein
MSSVVNGLKSQVILVMHPNVTLIALTKIKLEQNVIFYGLRITNTAVAKPKGSTSQVPMTTTGHDPEPVPSNLSSLQPT